MANGARWMAFVDGENLTIRGQALAEQRGLTLKEGRYFRRDCFVWLPNVDGKYPLAGGPHMLGSIAVRANYYASVSGDEALVREVRGALWDMGFDGHVFKKTRKEEKAKGVDIALTKDMLSHAFGGNYDTAVLMAGDGDYVPLVEEVKWIGKRVFVVFFYQNGLSEELRLASDGFSDITETFLANWQTAT